MLPLLLLIAVSSSACGYFMSGTWEDDPKNWKRAFGSTRPPDVVVVHSKYWRSAHWSYEFQYFFEIAPNAPLRAQLFTTNKLRRVPGADAESVRSQGFVDRPAWFAPQSTADYEIWVFDNEPGRNFKVLIDRESGHLFVSDYLM